MNFPLTATFLFALDTFPFNNAMIGDVTEVIKNVVEAKPTVELAWTFGYGHIFPPKEAAEQLACKALRQLAYQHDLYR